MDIKTTLKIPLEDIADLLFSAFDSPRPPRRFSVVNLRTPTIRNFKVHANTAYTPYVSECILNKGGHVVIVDLESTLRPLPRYKITRHTIKDALTLFATLHPSHFRDFLLGNTDKETSRAFTLTILALFTNKK